MNTTLTLPELARQAGVSESTSRRYAKNFSEFIPGERKGRVTVYPSASVTVLQRIKQLYEAGYNTEQVHDRLSEEFDKVIETTPAGGGGSGGRDRHPSPETTTELQSQEIVKQLVDKLQERRFDEDILNMILNRLDYLEKRVKSLENKKSFWKKFRKKN